MNDVGNFDEELADKLSKQPTEYLPLVRKTRNRVCNDDSFFQFELAAREVADDVTKPRPEGDEELRDIQVILHSEAMSRNIRELKVPERKI